MPTALVFAHEQTEHASELVTVLVFAHDQMEHASEHDQTQHEDPIIIEAEVVTLREVEALASHEEVRQEAQECLEVAAEDAEAAEDNITIT